MSNDTKNSCTKILFQCFAAMNEIREIQVKPDISYSESLRNGFRQVHHENLAEP